MKKILILILGLCLTFVLIDCDGSGSSYNSDNIGSNMYLNNQIQIDFGIYPNVEPHYDKDAGVFIVPLQEGTHTIENEGKTYRIYMYMNPDYISLSEDDYIYATQSTPYIVLERPYGIYFITNEYQGFTTEWFVEFR